MAAFAEQLTAARKAAGMTQEELAEAVHVARNTISNWERGQRQPDLETVRLLGQILHTDFINTGRAAEVEIPLPERPGAENEESPDVQPGEVPGTSSKSTRLLPAAAAVLAVLLLVVFFLLPLLQKKTDKKVQDAGGTHYAVSDFDRTTPNEDGKAYLTIEKTLTVRPGDGKDYYAINFTAHEDNGIAFSTDRMDLVIFFEDHADPYVFSHNDLAGAGYNPDIPAYGFLSVDNGFPTDQKGLKGMSIRIIGKDENGAELIFTSYLSIP
ncbi:MAG: helix-turn-helix domain-containing protein [Clostridiales bacterium]|nr:helix-turn-helix domain-containing protein [Clostridiales bacterium]